VWNCVPNTQLHKRTGHRRSEIHRRVPFFYVSSMSMLRLPGLIDAHVHLREPGGEQKEDMASGSAAALHGGVTILLDMPNTYPPIVDGAALARKQQLARQKALCDVGFYVGATETNAQKAAGLAGQAVGLKVYLDQTYGPLRMRNLAALLAHFRTWPAGRPNRCARRRAVGGDRHRAGPQLWPAVAPVPRQPGQRDRVGAGSERVGRGADLRGDAHHLF